MCFLFHCTVCIFEQSVCKYRSLTGYIGLLHVRQLSWQSAKMLHYVCLYVCIIYTVCELFCVLLCRHPGDLSLSLLLSACQSSGLALTSQSITADLLMPTSVRMCVSMTPSICHCHHDTPQGTSRQPTPSLHHWCVCVCVCSQTAVHSAYLTKFNHLDVRVAHAMP